jgi:hypothetical protein
MEVLEQPLWGIAGGIFAEALRWYLIRDELHKGMPVWASRGYWAITAIMAVIGGLLVLAYQRSGVHMQPFLAANVGASAPAILSTLLRGAPEVQALEPTPHAK